MRLLAKHALRARYNATTNRQGCGSSVISGMTFAWASWNASIVTANATGIVTAVANCDPERLPGVPVGAAGMAVAFWGRDARQPG
jgi:hypothetical protein